MKRLITYIFLILLFSSLGYIGLINQPVDYLNFDVIDNTYYKYNIKENTYEEIKVSKETIDYKGNSFNLNGCSKYKYNQDTRIIKMDCGRAFRVTGQSKEYLVLNINNQNYYFFNEKEKSYSQEFNAYFNMTEEDYIFEVNEKLAKLKINSDLFEELIESSNESYVFIRNDECNETCLTLAYNIDKLTEDNIYYIEKSDLNENQLNLLNRSTNNSSNQKIVLIGNGNFKVIDVFINSIVDDLTGYLDKNNEG